MSVDLSFGNSIIDAFRAGKQERENKEQKIKDEAFRQKQFELEKKQHEDALAQQREQFNARQKFESHVQDIQDIIAKQKIAEDFSITGDAPADSTVTKPKYYTPSPGIEDKTNGEPIQTGEFNLSPGQVQIEHPVLGKITTLTPEARAERIGRTTAIANQPALEASIEAEKRKAGFLEASENRKAQFAKELENLKSANDIKEQEKKSNAAYRLGIDKAKIMAAASGAKGKVDPADRPIPPKILKSDFGISDYSKVYTYKDMVGRKLATQLTVAQQNEIKALDAIEDQTQLLLDSLNDPEAQKYFQGLEGFITDKSIALHGGETDPVAAKLAAKLGKLQQVIALADFGKVIPATEKEILKSYAPTAEHHQTFESVKDKLQNMLEHAQSLKANAYQIGGSPTIGGGEIKPKVIKFDKDGNVIPQGN